MFRSRWNAMPANDVAVRPAAALAARPRLFARARRRRSPCASCRGAGPRRATASSCSPPTRRDATPSPADGCPRSSWRGATAAAEPREAVRLGDDRRRSTGACAASSLHDRSARRPLRRGRRAAGAPAPSPDRSGPARRGARVQRRALRCCPSSQPDQVALRAALAARDRGGRAGRTSCARCAPARLAPAAGARRASSSTTRTCAGASYGFIDYRRLARARRRARLPRGDGDDPARRRAAARGRPRGCSRARRDRLSLVFHGNDHVKHELLAAGRRRSARSPLAAQAVRRIERFERRARPAASTA